MYEIAFRTVFVYFVLYVRTKLHLDAVKKKKKVGFHIQNTKWGKYWKKYFMV